MREPDLLNSAGRPLSPEERRRVARAAFLRPMNLLVVLVGGVFFALTLVWWAIPLTLVTYAVLVFLAVRDPPEGRSGARGPPAHGVRHRRIRRGGASRAGRLTP